MLCQNVAIWKVLCSKKTLLFKVFDGPSPAYKLLAQLCGIQQPNGTIVSTSNYMYIEMRSDAYLTSKGFLAKYETVSTPE